MVATTTAARMTDAIRNREFRALWIAEAQSVLGDHLTTVALSIVVYSRTGSALWAAGVYALTFLPALVGGLGLSQIADRFPRKTVLVGSVRGPCGDLTKSMRQFPFRPVPAGRYRIRFTGTPFYDPQGFWIGYREVVVPKAKAVR